MKPAKKICLDPERDFSIGHHEVVPSSLGSVLTGITVRNRLFESACDWLESGHKPEEVRRLITDAITSALDQATAKDEEGANATTQQISRALFQPTQAKIAEEVREILQEAIEMTTPTKSAH